MLWGFLICTDWLISFSAVLLVHIFNTNWKSGRKHTSDQEYSDCKQRGYTSESYNKEAIMITNLTAVSEHQSGEAARYEQPVTHRRRGELGDLPRRWAPFFLPLQMSLLWVKLITFSTLPSLGHEVVFPIKLSLGPHTYVRSTRGNKQQTAGAEPKEYSCSGYWSVTAINQRYTEGTRIHEASMLWQQVPDLYLISKSCSTKCTASCTALTSGTC